MNESHHVPLQQQEEICYCIFGASITHTHTHTKISTSEHMVRIFLPAQLTCFHDVSGSSPLRLQSHLHRFCGFHLLFTASEKGYQCYRSKNRLLLFPPDMKREGIKNRVKHQLKWVLSPHEVYWGTVVPSCPGDGGGCFKLSTGKASFWLQWSPVPGRDWEYWIIPLSHRPHSSSFWFMLVPRVR